MALYCLATRLLNHSRELQHQKSEFISPYNDDKGLVRSIFLFTISVPSSLHTSAYVICVRVATPKTQAAKDLFQLSQLINQARGVAMSHLTFTTPALHGDGDRLLVMQYQTSCLWKWYSVIER